MEQSPRVNALDHLVLTVANISDTCRFYQDVLGMQADGHLLLPMARGGGP